MRWQKLARSSFYLGVLLLKGSRSLGLQMSRVSDPELGSDLLHMVIPYHTHHHGAIGRLQHTGIHRLKTSGRGPLRIYGRTSKLMHTDVLTSDSLDRAAYNQSRCTTLQLYSRHEITILPRTRRRRSIFLKSDNHIKKTR